VVKGDSKVAEISAASIIAKVHRDHQMLEVDKQFPQ
jgi:ribonuclease HII